MWAEGTDRLWLSDMVNLSDTVRKPYIIIININKDQEYC